MSPRTERILLFCMFAVAAAVRINNAFLYPGIRGYDGFAHFIYIWFLSETGRVPLATTGWSFFHPPFYYALMAAMWKGLAGVDALVRLNIATAVMSLLTLTHAAVSYVIVRRCFPDDRVIRLLAPGLMLFLPVHIYSAPFLGNEGLNAVLCSLALWAVLRTLEKRSFLWAVILGICLGLAMLTKFSSLAVVAGAFGTLALRCLVRGDWKRDGSLLAVAASTMLVVCGWYYVRNLQVYGTPFKLSRDEFMVQHVEHIQTKGARGIAEYLLFDPLILYRPMWPRGLPLAGELPPDIERSTVREAVWTGMYANTWFDGFGGWILPFVTDSELARRLGQILLTLGIVPTWLIIAGLATAIVRTGTKGWDDARVTMLLTFSTMIVIFIQGTRTAPLHAAIKATYFMPITLIFSYWLALGLSAFRSWRPRWRPVVVTVCCLQAVIATVTFWQGLLFPVSDLRVDSPGNTPWRNMYGIIYYAAGDRDSARELFEGGAARNYHLAWENLAAMALEEKRPLEALYSLRRAARLQPRQVFGTPEDRQRYNQLTRAEYLNSMAVMYYELGWLEEARKAAGDAAVDDPGLPEAQYDLAVLQLAAALEAPPRAEALRAMLIENADRRLQQALALDPGFWEVEAMRGTAAALLGDCDAAQAAAAKAASTRATTPRLYPAETGPGIPHAAAIDRRRHISPPSEIIDAARSRCPATGSPAA